MKRRAKQTAVKRNLANDAEKLDRTLGTLESRRKHRCIWFRNEYIKKRIKVDFARRQRKLIPLAKHDQQKYNGSVEVFPVSVAAFRDLLKKKKNRWLDFHLSCTQAFLDCANG